MARKKKRLKKKFSFMLTVILIIVAFVILDKALTNNENFIKLQQQITEEFTKKEREEEEKRKLAEQENLYNNCLEEEYNEENNTLELKEQINKINTFLKKYNCSVIYYDIDYGFNYSYNSSKVYYAASTIKTLDALYIYNKAASNELDLDETITYKSSNMMSDSKEMKKHKVGEKISLRNLVKYAITVSDNTAHDMLINYIGKSNLKAYGNSLGAKYTLIGDNFGEITVDDALIYLKELNKFIEENEELGLELKQFFLDSEQNYLNFPDLDILAGQKYGEYGFYYHELGIVYAKHPYLVAILTTEGKKESVIRSINEQVYELHKKYYEEKEVACYNKVYSSEE